MSQDEFEFKYPAHKGKLKISKKSRVSFLNKEHVILFCDKKQPKVGEITAYLRPNEQGGYEPSQATITFVSSLAYFYSEDSKIFLNLAKKAETENFHFEKARFLKWAILSMVFAIEALLNEVGSSYALSFSEGSPRKKFFDDEFTRLSLTEKFLLWADFITDKNLEKSDLKKEFKEIQKLRDKLVHAKPLKAELIMQQLTFGEAEKAVRVFNHILKVFEQSGFKIIGKVSKISTKKD